jgi:putative peptidoglycan lipid II flippase
LGPSKTLGVETMRLIRSIVTVGVYTIGSRVVGFLRTTLQASLLGAGPMADALVIAIKIPNVLRRMFAEGAFNASFVPIFAGLLAREGPEKARSYAENIFSILLIALVILTLVAEFLMPHLITVVVSGFSRTPERLMYTIEYTRITFPFILFISICALFSGILNSLEKFAAAAASPMFGNIGILVTVYALVPFVNNVGRAFSFGICVCGIIQAFWVLWPAWRRGMGLRLCLPHFGPDIKKFFKLLGPAALGSGVVQVNIFLDMLIASYLPTGSVSYLEYADRLNQLPLSVIGIAIGTALLPLLSKQIRTQEMTAAHTTQNLALEYAMVLAIPATIGLFVLAYPSSQTVFQHGRLGPTDTLEVSYTLMAFALGLPAYILIKIFSTIFFARENTVTPVVVACIAVVLNLALNLLLYRSFAHVGLAFSTATSAWFNAFLLAYLLHRPGHLVLSGRFKKFLPKMIFSTVACLATIHLIERHTWDYLESSKWTQISRLCLLIGGGFVIYIVMCFMTGIFKSTDLKLKRQTQLQ